MQIKVSDYIVSFLKQKKITVILLFPQEPLNGF